MSRLESTAKIFVHKPLLTLTQTHGNSSLFVEMALAEEICLEPLPAAMALQPLVAAAPAAFGLASWRAGAGYPLADDRAGVPGAGTAMPDDDEVSHPGREDGPRLAVAEAPDPGAAAAANGLVRVDPGFTAADVFMGDGFAAGSTPSPAGMAGLPIGIGVDATSGAEDGDAGASSRLASITGTVRYDLDADGVHDPGEPGLAGWTVYIDDNRNDRLDPGEQSVTTGANGSYAFTGLEAGSYAVRQRVPEDHGDWWQTYPEAGNGDAGLTDAERGATGGFPSPSPAQGQSSGSPVVITTAVDEATADEGPAITAEEADGLLVCFADGTDPAAADAFLAGFGAERVASILSGTLHHIRVEGDLADVIAACEASPLVAFAEANWILTSAGATSLVASPDDDRFDQLWAMDNTGQTGGTADADIDAPEAWTVSTGAGVVVGVIDTGVDTTHPDLKNNIWVNPGEIAGNGVDDDGNGYVDDIHGWDFYNNDNDPFDDNGHGTHVAGTIAAEAGNGIGVAGVAPQAEIMALKFMNASGSGTVSKAVAAIDYATQMGARITSNSWSIDSVFSHALYNAIAAAGAAGSLFIAAAGNDGRNTDQVGSYPAAYDLDNIISVAATDHNDNLAGFSNYGVSTVDLGAPGSGILSTVPGGSYGHKSGTSMATPHVSGAAALVLSANPGLTAAEVKDILLADVDPVEALAGKTASGGRLNAASAVNAPELDDGQLFAVGDGETLAGVDFGVTGPSNATPGDDELTGTDGIDVIDALAGNDTVKAGGGPDVVFGGDGDDWIDGGAGGDSLDGGSGTDVLAFESAAAAVTVSLETGVAQVGADDEDWISGFENLIGSAYDDELSGDGKANQMAGQNGDDRLEGGGGDDDLWGGDGRDTVFGDSGNDWVHGGDGDDRIFGGPGNDTLGGGNGDDYLAGAGGSDYIYGHAGTDTAEYVGSFADYQVRVSAGSAQVWGTYGRDWLLSVEFLRFSDGVYDISGEGAVLV